MPIGAELRKQQRSRGYQEDLVSKANSAIISSTNSQTEEVIYTAGSSGSRTPVSHPYLGPNSWIRIMPEKGTKCMISRRGEDNEPYISAYISEATAKQYTQSTEDSKFYYRSLREGETDIASPGIANIFLAKGGNLEIRGGLTSMKFQADGGEIQSRAPTHTRKILGNKRQEVGDEERFGVVQRPGSSLGQNTLRNIVTMPVPVVGPNFAKEYLRILRSDSTPGLTLVEHKEGDVCDDSGILQQSGGVLLRSITKYGTLVPGIMTSVEVDVVGSVSLKMPPLSSLLAEVEGFGSIKMGKGDLAASSMKTLALTSLNINVGNKTTIATTIKGTLFEAKTNFVKLGPSATQSGVLGELLLQYLLTHTHGTGVGPSSAPIVPPTLELLSKVVKLT